MRKICVIGLGYVGAPLAKALSKHHSVIGFDHCPASLQKHFNEEVPVWTQQKHANVLKQPGIVITCDQSLINTCDTYIICVPTPVNSHHQPDTHALVSACQTVAANLSAGDIVIIESTVAPGMTEGLCVNYLNNNPKQLTLNDDYYLAYAPERVSPGTDGMPLESVNKIVGYSSEKAVEALKAIYGPICQALKLTDQIKAAEASKLLENIQRDVNIALMNEYTEWMQSLGISMQSVLSLAKTKWNFLPFVPGLVGGHCIAVDPYYALSAAKDKQFELPLIAQSRRLNEGMPEKLANVIDTQFKAANIQTTIGKAPRIALVGVTYKANCDDLRGSRIFNLAEHLIQKGYEIRLVDELADWTYCPSSFLTKQTDMSELVENPVDGIVITQPHHYYVARKVDYWQRLLQSPGFIFEVINQLSPQTVHELKQSGVQHAVL